MEQQPKQQPQIGQAKKVPNRFKGKVLSGLTSVGLMLGGTGVRAETLPAAADTLGKNSNPTAETTLLTKQTIETITTDFVSPLPQAEPVIVNNDLTGNQDLNVSEEYKVDLSYTVGERIINFNCLEGTDGNLLCSVFSSSIYNSSDLTPFNAVTQITLKGKNEREETFTVSDGNLSAVDSQRLLEFTNSNPEPKAKFTLIN